MIIESNNPWNTLHFYVNKSAYMPLLTQKAPGKIFIRTPTFKIHQRLKNADEQRHFKQNKSNFMNFQKSLIIHPFQWFVAFFLEYLQNEDS